MPGTACADLTVQTAPSVDALPPNAAALLDDAASLFESRAWWNVTLAHALPPGAAAVFLTVRSTARVLAVAPMQRSNGRLASLTTPYTCLYQPLLAQGLDRATRIAAMTELAHSCRAAGVVRLDALPAEWDGLAGLAPLRFDHFGNWSEDVAGLAWSDYLQRRPGALRETIRRRLRRAERLPDARFALYTRPDQMDRAAQAFETVYARSWKDSEPYPDFNVALMRATAAAGWLRLGVWSVGADAVAVQFWVVTAGHAIVLKLAHDEAFKALSPGTVLTALMLRHLLDNEHVARIDFGRGDDPYKQDWVTERRQRVGLLLANPARPAGMAALLRHAAGRLRRTLSGPPEAHPP
jgi:CelD/BcsL family acetyltransferase involved in cellulose biosynthesis